MVATLTLCIFTVIVILHHAKKTKSRSGGCPLVVMIDFSILIWSINRNRILKNWKKNRFFESLFNQLSKNQLKIDITIFAPAKASILFLKEHVWCVLGNQGWLRMKWVNFDFSAKSSPTDYNESNKPTLKSLAHIGSEKSLVELGIPKMSFFTFSHFSFYRKVYFSPWAMGWVKS